jgi:hypothetical protein
MKKQTMSLAESYENNEPWNRQRTMPVVSKIPRPRCVAVKAGGIPLAELTDGEIE